MRHQYTTAPPPAATADDEIELAHVLRREEIELELLSEVFHHSAKCWPVALAAGARVDLFHRDDLRIIASGVAVAAEEGADWRKLHHCLSIALRNAGFWQPEAPLAPPYGPWNHANLLLLKEARYFSTSAIRYFSRRLKEIDRAERDAHEHMAHARRLLRGEAA
ncbi:MAG TPA: hypothetical protein VFC78_11315 [Tepidisphaeraceae bacterium]|nr:hypothetical protein [Tepidisphaeraceae bacterium]